MMTIYDRPQPQVAPPVPVLVDHSSTRSYVMRGSEPTDLRLPDHLARKLSPDRPHASDPTSRRIASLLRLHPELDREYASVDLRRLLPGPKRLLLQALEARLQIA